MRPFKNKIMKQEIDNSKTLFSQGGILIKKFINRNITNNNYIHSSEIPITTNEELPTIKSDNRIVGKIGKHPTVFKCVSPLGFYYYKNERCYNNNSYKEIGLRQKYWFCLDGCSYEISYLKKYNDTSIGHETRPWDLVGNGMSDHFINDLEKVLNQIIDELHGNKYDKEKIKSFKDNIFIDLFGDVDGIKIQTNDLKILSHGFDLKTSFRKDKEK